MEDLKAPGPLAPPQFRSVEGHNRTGAAWFEVLLVDRFDGRLCFVAKSNFGTSSS